MPTPSMSATMLPTETSTSPGGNGNYFHAKPAAAMPQAEQRRHAGKAAMKGT